MKIITHSFGATFTGIYLACAVPAMAADDTEKTGIAAGIGVAAASGKTSLGDGAGAIEASLLNSDAVLKAGSAIREIAHALRTESTRPILIVSKGDTVDFSMGLWVLQRMDELAARGDRTLSGAKCVKEKVLIEETERKAGILKSTEGDGTTKKFGFALSDITAALASDISVGAIKLTAEDRVLISAIQMGRGPDPVWRDVATIEKNKLQGIADPDFRTLGERQMINPASNPAFTKLARLQAWTDQWRHCGSDEFKATVETIDKFVASVLSAEKGTPAILAAAEAANAVPTDMGITNFGAMPYILRVSIDDIGGTSVTRSNVWFSLGMPGAAVITSGLKVSFQLSDPSQGSNIATGMVRCATRPISYREVQAMLVTVESKGSGSLGDRQKNLVTCAYRLS
ncbi:hypothetical protein [Sphingomonas sp.]|jgi:hypothetical protein|uniref:hypothetical protein n=1 Tax=Sphingomonas sp. TaxID=28214 RepID=UPI002E0DA410|nr:hypothetical protein [Sphingomonas sp.]